MTPSHECHGLQDANYDALVSERSRRFLFNSRWPATCDISFARAAGLAASCIGSSMSCPVRLCLLHVLYDRMCVLRPSCAGPALSRPACPRRATALGGRHLTSLTYLIHVCILHLIMIDQRPVSTTAPKCWHKRMLRLHARLASPRLASPSPAGPCGLPWAPSNKYK